MLRSKVAENFSADREFKIGGKCTGSLGRESKVKDRLNKNHL